VTMVLWHQGHNPALLLSEMEIDLGVLAATTSWDYRSSRTWSPWWPMWK